jgi:hypothetical protein
MLGRLGASSSGVKMASVGAVGEKSQRAPQMMEESELIVEK